MIKKIICFLRGELAEFEETFEKEKIMDNQQADDKNKEEIELLNKLSSKMIHHLLDELKVLEWHEQQIVTHNFSLSLSITMFMTLLNLFLLTDNDISEANKKISFGNLIKEAVRVFDEKLKENK